MKELMVLVAKTMSREQILDRMEQAISNYKEAQLLNQSTEDALNEIELSTHLFLLNNLKKDAGEILNDMEKVVKSVRFFETDSN